MKQVKLQERLIAYSVEILRVTANLPDTIVGIHFTKQLVRSGTSPAFHHGEAQSAESRKDFIHKLKIGLKELRETHINLLIIKRKPLLKAEKVMDIIEETNQLISIFVKSIQTARKNMAKQ